MPKLYFRYGTMDSSKSMNLLSTAYNYKSRGLNVLLLKPAKDTRDVAVIKSRIGIEMPCSTYIESDDLYELVKAKSEEKKIDAVLVDECQFSTVLQIKQLWKVVVRLGIVVQCFGLRTNYLGEGFESTKELMILAHDIEEIKTVCRCGNKATHHLLKLNGEYHFSGDGVFVGDTEFESVCGSCWLDVYEKFSGQKYA